MSPDESSMASPVRLKRYEGFDHGLNVMGRSRGGPYRNKSPPVKKTKRKETIDFGPPSTPNEKNNDRYVFLGELYFYSLHCPNMKMNDTSQVCYWLIRLLKRQGKFRLSGLWRKSNLLNM